MKNFQRIFDLIRKTGDRYIFEDQYGNIFVIVNINDYENIVLGSSQIKDLSEEELLNKINKDIAIWQASKQTNTFEDIPQTWDEMKEKIGANKDEDQYYFDPEEIE